MRDSETEATRRFNDWKRFHQENPHVWRKFVELAFKLIDKGHERYSARAIFHVMRYHAAIAKTTDPHFLLNNNYTPYYVRLWRLRFPQHASLFATRTAKADQPTQEATP